MAKDRMYEKIYDVSVGISETMPAWPGDLVFKRTVAHSLSEGASSEVSVLEMSSHTGTHVDAPAHFLQGAPSIDRLPLDVLVGEAVVVEIQSEKSITPQELKEAGVSAETRVLCKTRNSALWDNPEFTADFVYFTPEAAQYLVDAGVKLIGIDYLSVGEYHEGTEVHHILLENGVVVVEGLNLTGVEPGRYEIMCLPLKIIGADGAPARVLLARR